ncbi:hypothetical protein PMAYCL1PPCAC_30009, partial [Pristionchus mayeri]
MDEDKAALLSLPSLSLHWQRRESLAICAGNRIVIRELSRSTPQQFISRRCRCALCQDVQRNSLAEGVG